MFLYKIAPMLICTFCSFPTFAQLPQDSRRAGGIAVIPLSADITQVLYQQKPVLISQENGKRYAVFGIPLSVQLGTLSLNTNSTPIQIEVKLMCA